MSNDINLRESIKLPSQGLLYPIGHPFHNKPEIEINLITGLDEQLLTSKSLIKSGKVTNKLLERLISHYNVDISTLLVADKNAILIFARLLSMGTSYKAICYCKYCGEPEEYNFDVSNVPINFLDTEKCNQLAPNENLFEFTTSKGTVIKFKLATVGILQSVDDDMEGLKSFNKKHAKYNQEDETIKSLYRKIIESINDDKTPIVVDNFLNGPILESREFRKHIADIAPSIEFKSEFYCTECGRLNDEVSLPFNENFFWVDF